MPTDKLSPIPLHSPDGPKSPATELMTGLINTGDPSATQPVHGFNQLPKLEPKEREMRVTWRRVIADAIVNPAHDGGATFGVLMAVQAAALGFSFALGCLIASL